VRKNIIALLVVSGLLLTLGLLLYSVNRPHAPESREIPAISDNAPSLRTEAVAEGLRNVWDVAELPDGKIVFTERAGTISIIDGTTVSALGMVQDIEAKGEGGLMGLAVDPSFQENRFIYACYNTVSDIRLSRWRVADDHKSLSDKTDIISGIPANEVSGRHSGCRPRISPEGVIWLGTGDTARGRNPQDPRSLAGKILRVTRDGAAVEGNLPEPFDPRIFSYGHRNVQGIALFDTPRDGVFGFSAEHGPGTDDELNVLKSGNFGWDPVPEYNETVPMTDLTKYPNAIEAAWKSGRPTIAPSGIAVLSDQKWKGWQGAVAMAVLKDQHVCIMEYDENFQVTSQQELFKGEYGRIRSVVSTKDGSLLLTTDNGRNDLIVRIIPE